MKTLLKSWKILYRICFPISLWISLVHSRGNKNECGSTIILHIGPPKTGTTHLQRFLYNHEKVLANDNWYWPRGPLLTNIEAPWPEKSISMLAMDLEQHFETGGYVKETRDFLQQACKQKHNVIISSEYFASYNETSVKLLKELVEGFQVKILMSYRNLASFLASSVREVVEHFECPIYDISTLIILCDEACLSAMNPNKYLPIWKQQFGQENLVIMDYSGILSTGKDIGCVSKVT